MNKRVGLFLLILVTAFAACKSKKAVTSKHQQTKYTNKELKALSHKLNLEIEKDDNVKLYQFVAQWLGTPHKLGACTKSAIDCSCFVVLLYTEVYQTKLPRTSIEMHQKATTTKQHKLKEGDLVFFSIKSKKVSHVGVYLKNGWFAHVTTSKGVMINNLSEEYYEKYFTSGGSFN